MKGSSIRISRGGRSIHFKGKAASAAFTALTGVKLPPFDKPASPAQPPQPPPSLDKCHGSEVSS